jgi:hypothetical protein
METHVKVLGVLYLVVSGLSLLAALFLLLAIGGAAGIVGVAADPQDAAIAIPVLGIAGTALGVMLLLLALPGLLTGWGLLTYSPWARILGIVLSALNLLNIPVGTALGLYGLWVLLNKDTERLFASTSLPTTS